MRSVLTSSLSLFVFSSSVAGFVIPTRTNNRLDVSLSPSKQTTCNEASNPVRVTSNSALSLSDNNDNNSNSNSNNIAPSFSPRKLIGPLFIGLLALQSLLNLTTRELPPILTGQPNADYFGAVFDTLFLGWAGQTLLLQTGALADSMDGDAVEGIALDGFECRVNVNVGREQGTWMEDDWAASGARLVLPVHVQFTNESMDLGIPGEEGLGGRYCRRLKVINNENNVVSFIGPQGRVEVPVMDGGWATLPILNQKMEAGERKLRFFLEFPEGAKRNDVSIPAGRVFFSSAVFPSERANDVAGDVSLLKAPGGAGILTEGGVTIKSNGGIMNLWGAAGDVNLILGRYSVSEISAR